MTLRELVLQWNSDWRYDYWWRQKHNIPFNSRAHREANQLDIAFEYFEAQLSNQALEEYQDEEAKKKLRESGQWIQRSKSVEKKIEQLFANKDQKDVLASFND